MPTFGGEKEDKTTIMTLVNATSGTIISTNSTFEELVDNNSSDDPPEVEYEHWPNWVQQVTCVSHLTLAFNSSVNFFIYLIKRRALHLGIVFPIIIQYYNDIVCNIFDDSVSNF